jgi:hypothetical protein
VLGVESRFYRRAVTTFERGDGALQEAITGMLADHSAKGRLGSGSTAIAARRIFEEHTSRALDQVLGEAAKLIEHRGRDWQLAMSGIGSALHDRLTQAPEKLSRAVKLSGARDSKSALSALDRELSQMRQRLVTRFVDFRDGWTAPVAKPWPDRHRVLYAVGLLLLGAIVGTLVKVIFSGARVPLP